MVKDMISILTPVYNVEDYLEECLRSLMAQTYEKLEFICVDDGSTDGSGAILDRFAAQDARFRVVHKDNSGYGSSMNIALDMAEGEYIAIVESDDFIEDNMMERLHEVIVSQKADVVKSNHYDLCDGETLICNRLEDYPKYTLINCHNTPELLNMADTIWSCLYSADFLRRNNIRFHETPGAAFQDISFSLQCWLRAERVYFTEDKFLHYRNDNPGSSMHNPDKVFCVMDEYGWIEEIFAGFFAENPILEKYIIASKFRDYLNHYYRVAAQYQFALILRIADELRGDIADGRLDTSYLPPELAGNLEAIEKDTNAFYKRTAKAQADEMRMSFYEFENEDSYQAGFVQRLKEYPSVMIYGAGVVGKKLANWLTGEGVRPECFIVTNLGTETEYHGIPIREIEAVADKCDSAAVIVGVVERNQFEICRTIHHYHFKHVFRYDPVVKDACR